MSTGVIHDLGYQRYTGPRLGRGYVFRSLYVHTLRTAFGLGRGVKAKLFSWTIAGIVLMAGVVITAIGAIGGEVPVTHPDFVGQMSVLTILFLAIVAPELVSRDQHTRMLTLYVARPMRRTDYAFARLSGLVTAVFLVLTIPQVVMLAGAALSTDDGFRGVTTAFGHFFQGTFHAALHAALLGSISLLVASLVKQRAVAAAAVVAVFLVTTPLLAITEGLEASEGAKELAALASPPATLSYLGDWLYTGKYVAYGPVLALAVAVITLVCVALLAARYRKVSA